MSKKTVLAILAVLALALLSAAVVIERGRLDAMREAEREHKDAAERHRMEQKIAQMAQKWKASTDWNRSPTTSAALNPSKLQSVLAAHPTVVFLGRLDSIVADPRNNQYFVTLTDVEDRLLVKLVCDGTQIGKFRDAAGVGRLYAQFAVAAKINDVTKMDDLPGASAGNAGQLYDFEVQAECVDAMLLQFTDYTRMSDLKVPAV